MLHRIKNVFPMKSILYGLLAGALVLLAQQVQPLGPYGNIPWNSANTIASTSTATLSAYQMTGLLTVTGTTGMTLTTDTATNICALFPFVGNNAAQNWAYDFYVEDSGGSGTTTFAGGSGVTLVGTGTVVGGGNDVRHLKVVLNACPVSGGVTPTAAVQLISLETSAF